LIGQPIPPRRYIPHVHYATGNIAEPHGIALNISGVIVRIDAIANPIHPMGIAVIGVVWMFRVYCWIVFSI